MNRITIFILILLASAALGAADYFINIQPEREKLPKVEAPIAPDSTEQNLTNLLISKTADYKVLRRSRINQIFEKIDISRQPGLKAYLSELTGPDNILIYEIQGPIGQGGITYLNTKLAFLDALSELESINEENSFGHNSFFFNDQSSPNTGFLLAQIGDHLFGFQYSKETPQTFETIKAMINTLLIIN